MSYSYTRCAIFVDRHNTTSIESDAMRCGAEAAVTACDLILYISVDDSTQNIKQMLWTCMP